MGEKKIGKKIETKIRQNMKHANVCGFPLPMYFLGLFNAY
jgi:hypothetical protein